MDRIEPRKGTIFPLHKVIWPQPAETADDGGGHIMGYGALREQISDRPWLSALRERQYWQRFPSIAVNSSKGMAGSRTTTSVMVES